MEAFKKHNITHISASNISTFINDPASWVVSYIYKKPFKSGAAALRGTHIEKGLDQILSKHQDKERIIKDQIHLFTETCEYMKIPKEEYEQEYHFIKKAIDVLPKHFEKFGKIISYQKAIGYMYKGIYIKGYVDFEFEKNLIVDLKTSKQLKVTIAHKIAQHIYKTATNMENKLFYIQVLKKSENVMEYQLTDEDNIQIPLLIHQAIENMNYLCGLANTKDEFKRLITPNPDDWKWNNETKLKARKDIWGF